MKMMKGWFLGYPFFVVGSAALSRAPSNKTKPSRPNANKIYYTIRPSVRV